MMVPFDPNGRYQTLAQLEQETAVSNLHQHLAHFDEAEERAWLIKKDEEWVGYATLSSVPGLPDVADAELFIRLASRREGVGAAALDYLAAAAKQQGFSQLSYGVDNLNSPAARFLQKQGFMVEHEEQVLWLNDLRPFALPPVLPLAHTLTTFGWKTAVAHFLALYEASFAPHPWYQPYTAAEVEAMLVQPEDLLFLCLDHQPIGVSWLHVEGKMGRIEPIGVVPSGQGTGNGRLLLHASLYHLARRHAQKARIGAWTTNLPALTLYTSLGFQPSQTVTYFAKAFRSEGST